MSTWSSGSNGSNGEPNCSSRSSRGRTYECKLCGNRFSSGQSLGGHMNVHRKDQRSRSYRNGHSSTSNGNYYASPSDSCSTSYKGVRYRSEQNKWVAEIRPPKSSKTWWLGTYSTAMEAAYAYDVAITYFGSETSLNFEGHPVYDKIPRISPNLSKQDFALQLRKVVKDYGKRAMQLHDHIEEESEDQASCSYVDSSSACEYPQQEEYVVTDFDNELEEDTIFDLDAALSVPPSEADQSFGTDYAPTFDDFENTPPASYNWSQSENYSAYNYQSAADNYEPGNGMYYNHMMSPAISGHEASGYCNGSYNQPQDQLWSYYNNQSNGYW